jgi:PAS domain S-box-containing protein
VHSLAALEAGGLGTGLDIAPVPVSLWIREGDDFRIADVNQAGAAFLGTAREELIGRKATDFQGDHARGKRDMLRAIQTRSTVKREMPYFLPEGQLLQLEVNYVGISDDALLVFIHDVTPQRNAEERLRVTEDRYRALVAAANEGVWLVDASGRTTFANGRVGRILGRPLSEIAGSNLLDFVDERDRSSVAGAIECPRDTPDAFEARFRHADGTELLCLLSVSPMPSEGPQPATLCVLADMTVLQKERELRHQTERQFRRMIETAHEAIWTGDKEGRTTFINEAGARALGVDAEELLGRPLTDLIVYDEKAQALREQIRRDGRPLRGELRVRKPDGGTLEVLASISLMRDDAGEVIGSLAMITDITRIKREQAELRESRELFGQVFAEAPVGMAFVGAGHLVRGQFLGANKAFHELVGYSEQDLLEQDLFSITHPDDVETERALASALFEHQRDEYELDKRFVRPDGTIVWARFRAHVLRDENGAPLYGLGLAVDISAERAALDAAGSFDARARAVLDSTRDAVFEIAADGTIAELNGAALRMFAADPEDMKDKPLSLTLVPERLRVRVIQALGEWLRAAAEGRAIEPTETTMRRADGSEFPAAIRITGVEVAGELRLILWVRNLGFHDAAEAARREAEERFERLFRDGPVAAVAIDALGRLADVNPAFCKLAGRDAPALIGREASEVLADAGDAYEPPWQSGADRPGPVTAARRVARPDGTHVPVQLTASLVRDAGGAPLQWLCQLAPRTISEVASLPSGEPLSYRERQVLGLLARGHDGPAIAERLGLAPETVRSYANSAREKTGAKTRTEAVALALVRGEISL